MKPNEKPSEFSVDLRKLCFRRCEPGQGVAYLNILLGIKCIDVPWQVQVELVLFDLRPLGYGEVAPRLGRIGTDA